MYPDNASQTNRDQLGGMQQQVSVCPPACSISQIGNNTRPLKYEVWQRHPSNEDDRVPIAAPSLSSSLPPLSPSLSPHSLSRFFVCTIFK